MDCIVHGVAKSRTRLSDFHFRFRVELKSRVRMTWPGAGGSPGEEETPTEGIPRQQDATELAGSAFLCPRREGGPQAQAALRDEMRTEESPLDFVTWGCG